MEPLHAQGFFAVGRDGTVVQTILFQYWDEEEYYLGLLEKGLIWEELEEEKERMQSFLDGERVVINGERIRPRVVFTDISFAGKPFLPQLLHLVMFKGRLRRGRNVYENYYERVVAEYGFEAYWVFPEGSRVLEAEASGEVVIEGNVVAIYVEEGEEVAGWERIVWEQR